MPSQDIKGRIAIVTGASRGIGRAIAERLASGGATVVMAARSITASADGLDGTVQQGVAIIEGRGGKAVAMACDVENADSRSALINQVIARFGRIDILVNNAGRCIAEPVLDMTLAVSESQMEQYFMAPLHLSVLATPHMKRQGEGWIVNLGSSSVTPSGGDETGLALYSALKAAIHRMSASFSAELKLHNIAVNVVTPVAMILTPGTAAMGLDTAELRPFHEKVEHLAEATLALVSKPPKEQTGVVAFSYQWLDSIGRATMSLDGQTVIQARKPG